MWYFLAVDVVGGITPPIDFRSDFAKWMDANGRTIGILLAFFIIIVCGFILWRMDKKAKQQQRTDKEENIEDNDKNDKE